MLQHTTMWWSKKHTGALGDQVSALETAVEDLARCCENNTSALRPLRADMDLQWEKVNRAMARLAKRAAVDTVEDEGNGSPSQFDAISARIMRGEPI